MNFAGGTEFRIGPDGQLVFPQVQTRHEASVSRCWPSSRHRPCRRRASRGRGSWAHGARRTLSNLWAIAGCPRATIWASVPPPKVRAVELGSSASRASRRAERPTKKTVDAHPRRERDVRVRGRAGESFWVFPRTAGDPVLASMSSTPKAEARPRRSGAHVTSAPVSTCCRSIISVIHLVNVYRPPGRWTYSPRHSLSKMTIF